MNFVLICDDERICGSIHPFFARRFWAKKGKSAIEQHPWKSRNRDFQVRRYSKGVQQERLAALLPTSTAVVRSRCLRGMSAQSGKLPL